MTVLTVRSRRRTRRTAGDRRARATTMALSDEQKRRVRLLLDEPIDFMDHPSFHEPDAERTILDPATDIPRANIGWYSQIAMDGVVSQADKAVKPTNLPLLNAAQEKNLFLRYNFVRFMAETVRQSCVGGKGRVTVARGKALLQWTEQARQYREQIAEYNLALVLAMAQRIPPTNVEFQDLISEGNLALLRAIDKFDIGRGFKFSTYACRAMIKAFGRLGIKVTKYKNRFPVEFEPEFERSNHREIKAQEHELDCAEQVKHLFENNLAGLTSVEQEVIAHRFAMGRDNQPVPLTLEQVGQMVGLTKERVRQIQKGALNKLRDALETTFLNAKMENSQINEEQPSDFACAAVE